MTMLMSRSTVVMIILCLLSHWRVHGQQPVLRERYTKMERMVPMRDGTRLFTAVYVPKDTTELHPVIMTRTPYSCAPYGEQSFPNSFGNPVFARENYIVVFQDVRGRHMSDGNFTEMTPRKSGTLETDESSDAYDTIEWLLKNIAGHNGRVGILGISYPAFYAVAALPDAHPALKAVSPQAPVTDEFEGDDVYHRGAFFLLDNAHFLNAFDHPRQGPLVSYPQIDPRLSHIEDAYSFYLRLGPIKHINHLFFHQKSTIWNEYLAHDTKDAYWQARNIRPHLAGIKPAVLVVGGWFDPENLYGSLKTYEAIERLNPVNNSHLLMGPWTHGGWARFQFGTYATYNFNGNTTEKFFEMESAFFNYYLKQKGNFNQPEATIFFTGINQWRSFGAWPPAKTSPFDLYLNAGNKLSDTPVKSREGFEQYDSDPENPVPYSPLRTGVRDETYMGADQRFAAARPDVLHFATETLPDTVVLAGPVVARLFVQTSSTDADFVVKIIDVLPGGEQQLVRAEVLRGKFRNDFSKPEPFIPGKITPVTLTLNDIAHGFLPGHKIMVQVQSSWFPLVDRNPQTFMSIPEAEEKDFTKTTINVERNGRYPSRIEFSRVPVN